LTKMVQNFTIPKPEVHPVLANFGYVCGFLVILGMIIGFVSFSKPSWKRSSADMIIPIIIAALGPVLFYLRGVIFATNPSDAQLLPQEELNEIHQQMHGKWITTSPPQGFQINLTSSQISQNIDVANGQYTYTYYVKDRGQRQATRALNIYRTPDNKYWLDNYGNQIYKLDLPDLIVCNTYIGYDYTWRRTSDGVPDAAMAPNVSIHPTPTVPPSHDNSMGSNDVGDGDAGEKNNRSTSQGIERSESPGNTISRRISSCKGEIACID